MKILNVNNTIYNEEVAIVLGDFDGLHTGHLALINAVKKEAKINNIKSSVLFFNNHTRSVTKKSKDLNLLSDNEQKLAILRELNIDIVYSINFNKEMMSLSGEEFVKKILLGKLNTKVVVVGFNYKFGHKASCDASLLKKFGEKYGFKVIVVAPVCIDGQLISSTLIRNLIKQGNIKKANKFLGREYSIKGKVIEGYKRGRRLGFPTANLKADGNFTIPKFGVYKTSTVVDNKKYLSVTSVGKNPTYDEKDIKIETHLIDFKEDIYGQRLEIIFLEYMRDEIKFNSEIELINQISYDIKYAKMK